MQAMIPENAKFAVTLSSLFFTVTTARPQIKPDPPANKLEGKWRAVASELGAKPLGKEQISQLEYEFKGDVLTFIIKSRPFGAFKHKLDINKNPHELDIVAPGIGTTQAIVEFTGKTMRICFDNPGEKRLKAFKTETGSDQRLIAFEREDK